MKKKKNKRRTDKATDAAHTLRNICKEPQSTDILGSWTGTEEDDGVPVQDADDL